MDVDGMKKLTFKTQFRICMGVLILSFVLAHITKQGVFTNIAWIVYGLFFIINPIIEVSVNVLPSAAVATFEVS